MGTKGFNKTTIKGKAVSQQTFIDKIIDKIKKLDFPAKKQQQFLEDLSVLISDGVPANRAIEMLAKIYTGGARKAAIAISKGVASGRTLTDSMVGWFDTNTVELIRVGEEGGLLAAIIKNASKALSERAGSIAMVVATLLYPVTVLIAGCYVIVYINNAVFVDFKQIKPVDTWPAVGQELVFLATLIQNWYWLVLTVIVAVIVTIAIMQPNYVGSYRKLLDKVPPFSIYRTLAAARFMDNLGLLVINGVVFKNALKVMKKNATPYVLTHIINMEHLLAIGKDNIADVLDTGLISKGDILRLRVIAEAKGFEHALIRLGAYAAEKGAKTIKLTAKITGFSILGLGGAMIMFMVLAIYSVGIFLGSA